jgi:hypothetical protein
MWRKEKVERIGADVSGQDVSRPGRLGLGGSGLREPKEERCGDGGEDKCDGVEGDGVGVLV